MLLYYVTRHSFPRKCLFFYRTCANESKWRILFYGNGQFSLDSLRKLNEDYEKNITVSKLEIVTSTKKSNEVLKYAENNNLTVHSWPNFPSTSEPFDLGVVVSFGYLIPSTVIQKFPLGMLNVHASLLPRWRGAAPIIHCLLNGDSYTGVSIMRIQPKHFDIGDVIYQKKVDIPDDMLQPQLFNVLANVGSEALIKCIRELPDCLKNAQPQDTNLVTYAPKIKRTLAKVNWNEMTSLQIYNLSRALNGIFPLETQFRMHRVKFRRVYLCPPDKGTVPEHPTDGIKRRPGQFEFVKNKNVIRVWCLDNSCVYFNSVQVKSKSEMSAFEFRNGYMKNVSSGDLYFEYPS